MRSFSSLYLATVREFSRDFTALFWTLAFPVMFIMIFGLIFGSDENISFDVGLVNEDGAASAALVAGFEQVDAFDLSTGTRAAELDALENGDRTAVIIIPAGTSDDLEAYFTRLTAGSSVEQAAALLEVHYSNANQSSAQIVLDVIDKVVAGMNTGLTGVTPALGVETQQINAGENLRGIDYILPGVLAMSLMQLGLFGTAGPLVSLREKGVLRRMGATPLRTSTMLLSQVTFRLTSALVQTGLIIVVGVLLFDVHIEYGNLPVVLGMVLLGGGVFITMGYFISGLARTEESVQGIISLPNFIFMFLSGIFFPVELMPDWMRPVVDAIPLTYLGDGLRHAMLNAEYIHSMVTNVGVLAIWLVACAVLAVRFFKWEPQA